MWSVAPDWLSGAVQETFERKETEVMKRYVCTVAVGMLLMLVGAGTAAAGIERTPTGASQEGTQSVSSGDQTIDKQKNDADVTQAQGNDNVSLAPAFGFPKHHKGGSCSKEQYGKCGGGGHYTPDGGKASTWNAQGNGNTAVAFVGQSNDATQSQWASQTQTLLQDCCEEVKAE